MAHNLEHYNNLVDHFKDYFADQHGVDREDIKTRGESDFADQFREIWDVLQNYDKYDSMQDWQDALADAGADSEFWTAYHENQ